MEMRHVKDFTQSAFSLYLDLLLDSYTPILFTEFGRETEKYSILWRHDVDVSLNRAVALAEIEASKGIKSTYFIRIRSEYYNLFEKSQGKLVKRLKELGHDIGLHLDHEHVSIQGKQELEQLITLEKHILETELGNAISAFSYHNPSPALLKMEDDFYAGLVNAYSKSIKDRFKYVSDSNGIWRYENLRELLKNSKCDLQVLTHPEWWQEKELTPYDRIKRAIYGRAERVLADYSDFLEEVGRNNIGKK